MEHLITKTLRATEEFDPFQTLRYINEIWFNRFYRIHYKDSSVSTIVMEDQNLYVTGHGEDMVDAMGTIVKDCKIDPRILKSLESSPKYIDGKVVDIKSPPNSFLLNVSNSCALDSLLAIIFFAKGGYFMSRIQDSTLKKFPRWFPQDTISRAAESIQSSLSQIYNRTNWRLQNIGEIQRQISVYLKDDCADVKSVNEIWTVFCTMFDGLPFDILTKRQKEIGNNPIEFYSIPIGEGIFADDLALKPDHLVYLNDTTQGPVDFSALGYDMDGYDLVGVVLHWGAHYTSLVYVQEQWYAYDDLGGKISKFEGNPLKQTGSYTIAMMFYVKT